MYSSSSEASLRKTEPANNLDDIKCFVCEEDPTFPVMICEAGHLVCLEEGKNLAFCSGIRDDGTLCRGVLIFPDFKWITTLRKIAVEQCLRLGATSKEAEALQMELLGDSEDSNFEMTEYKVSHGETEHTKIGKNEHEQNLEVPKGMPSRIQELDEDFDDYFKDCESRTDSELVEIFRLSKMEQTGQIEGEDEDDWQWQREFNLVPSPVQTKSSYEDEDIDASNTEGQHMHENSGRKNHVVAEMLASENHQQLTNENPTLDSEESILVNKLQEMKVTADVSKKRGVTFNDIKAFLESDVGKLYSAAERERENSKNKIASSREIELMEIDQQDDSIYKSQPVSTVKDQNQAAQEATHELNHSNGKRELRRTSIAMSTVDFAELVDPYGLVPPNSGGEWTTEYWKSLGYSNRFE